MANVLGGPTICQRMNTAGTNLQNKLNARGVSCTYGKTTEGKLDINGLADLITSSNLKGANDYMISLTASRPYLLANEKTDLIARLTNGLGVPQANKTVTISVSGFNEGVIGALFDSDYWEDTVAEDGVLTMHSRTSSEYEFCNLDHYTLDLGFYDEGSLDFDVSFGGNDKIGIRGNGGYAVTYYKVVNDVETILGGSNVQSFIQGNQPIPLVLEREGNTMTLNGYSVTSSNLSNKLEGYHAIFYETDCSASSLYTGLTNSLGVFCLFNVMVTKDTTFIASYGAVSDSVPVESCFFADYCTNENNKSTGYYQPNGTYSLDDIGLILATVSKSLNFREYNGAITVPFLIEFEILSNEFTPRMYFYNGNYGTSICNGTFYTSGNAPTRVRFKVESGKITRYINDSSTELSLSTTIGSTVSCRIGGAPSTDGSIKLRNFRIKAL